MMEPIHATITITHPLGLHLRQSKDVVHVANRFEATITAQNLTRLSPAVDAKSILQLMQLQARQGHTLRVSALARCARGDLCDAVHL
ncbi:MAG: HPr family phosphocarrier protein [Caldilineaceae bacterium]|nr:HPr family phosphocarrier protein [Caldilineaceae bacterium]